MSNPIDRAADACHGLSRLARRLNKSAQTVSNWRIRGVPAEHCPAIERATGGAVRCEDLRPDIEWGVLRGSAAKEDQRAAA